MTGLPLNIDFQQVLFHLLNFVILFAIIFFLIYKPVKNFMDKRKQEYKNMDDEAEKKLAEANELKELYDQKYKSADEDIKKMISDASKDLAEKSTVLEREAKEHAANIIAKAQADAQVEQEKIINKTADHISELAKEAAKKVVFASTSDAMDAFLDKAEGRSKDE